VEAGFVTTFVTSVYLQLTFNYPYCLMSKLTAITLILSFLFAVPVPSGRVPRRAPNLTYYDASGKVIALSNFAGKVVVIEFLFIGSVHCGAVAQTLSRLNRELGSRGFQALGVAFSAPGSMADAAAVETFLQSYQLAIPVGYTSKENVDNFLSRGPSDVLNIPQVVVIDRAGVIRAQSGNRPGNPKLENEASLRALLDGLLKETAASHTSSVQSLPAIEESQDQR
jgi:peroxiredoxin